MTVEFLAKTVVNACIQENVEYMIAGAFAFGIYGIPRSTKDVDIVLSVTDPTLIDRIIKRLENDVKFGNQVQFDTLTWGKRHIGKMINQPQLQVELFELFDDPFVLEQFKRKVNVYSPQIKMEICSPTPEDVLIQKLRWARDKDLTDAIDILAVQGTQNLDMNYIQKWCLEHGSLQRLEDSLAKIPEGL